MQPIFICGVGRSGTKLLMNALGGHPLIHSTGHEDGFALAYAENPRAFLAAIEADAVGRLLRAIWAHTNHYAMFRRQAQHEKHGIPHRFDYHAFEQALIAALWDEAAGRIVPRSPAQAAMAYYRVLAGAYGEADRPYIVTKPGLDAQVMAQAAPHFTEIAPLILCTVRDPRAVVNSSLVAKPDYPLGQVVAQWRGHSAAVEQLRGHFPVYVVRYEDLVTRPEQTLSEAAAFIGVGYDPGMLTPRRWGATFSGNSSFDNSGGAITPASLERWRDGLTTDQIRQIELLAGDLMRSWGYPLQEVSSQAVAAASTQREAVQAVRQVWAQREAKAAVVFGVGAVVGALLERLRRWLTCWG